MLKKVFSAFFYCMFIYSGLLQSKNNTLQLSVDKLLVGSFMEITFTYIIADELARGAGIRIELPVAYAETEFLFWNELQTEEKDLPGYVSARTSTGVAVDLETYGIRGGIMQATLKDGTLGRGESIMLTYRGRVQSLASDFVIRAQERTAADKPWLDLQSPPHIRLLPQKAQTLVLAAPSDLVAGKPFDFSIIAMDKFGNLASGYRGTIKISTTDKTAELSQNYTFTEGDSGRHVFNNVKFNTTGFQKIDISSAGKLQVSTHYSMVSLSEPVYKHYFGDTHFHTGSGARNRGFILARNDHEHAATDGHTIPQKIVKRPNSPGDHRANFTTAGEAYRYARDVSWLDFASASEHDSYLFDDQAWNQLQDISQQFNDPGKFTTFFAYEWTCDIIHHIVLYKNRANRVFDRDECPDLPSLWAALDKQGTPALTIPHLTWDFKDHYNWDHLNNTYRKIGEIYSLWNSRYLLPPGDEPQRFELGRDNKWSFQYGWHKGHKIGVIGSTDNHLGQPGANNYTIYTQHSGGLAAALAEENSREALWDTFQKRRTYATTGTRIYMDFSVDGHPMGSEIKAEQAPLIQARIAGSNTLQKVEVVKYSKAAYNTIYSTEPAADTTIFEFRDESFDADCFYYLRVHQVDEIPGRRWASPTREMAWSSPIWVVRGK